MGRDGAAARRLSVGFGALAVSALPLLAGEGGWWALGMTLLLACASLGLLSVAAGWSMRLLSRRRRRPEPAPATSRRAAKPWRAGSTSPAPPAAAAERDRLLEQLRSTRAEWDRLQRDLRGLEFALSASARGAGPLEYVRRAHWRALDAEYRKKVHSLEEDLRGLMEPASGSGGVRGQG